MGASGTAWSWLAWREAWTMRRDNPLPRLWHLGEQRRQSRRPWWQRQPGLLLLGLALSVSATYLLWLVLQEFLGVRHSAVASVAFARGLALAGVQIFTVALAAFCLCWLLSRTYALAHFALALLGRARRKDTAGLDDAALASGISDEQVVLGVVLYSLRMLAYPLLAFSACGAALYCLWLCAPTAMALGQSDPASPMPLASAVLLALELLVLLAIGSLAGTALLALILLMLGRGTGPFAPVFGAVSLLLLQLLVAFAMVTSSAWIDTQDDPLAWWWVLLAGALALALFVFIFWVVHRSVAWRTICAHSLLALVALQALLQFWAGLIGSDEQLLSDFMGYVTGLSILLLSLLPAAVLHHVGAVFSGLYSSSHEFVELAADAGLLLACQAVLIIPLALLARDAVRLYRGGAA